MTILKNKTPVTDQNKDDPRWHAIVMREIKANGKFFYAVKTTGVYCHPFCAARLPRPENICFYTTQEEAEQAGFRPCKRCKPDRPSLINPHITEIIQSCRIIEKAEDILSFKDLAKQVGMSAYHFHRLFKQITGLTPYQYAVAHKINRIKRELSQESTVTQAILNAGYNSNSRFYEKSNEVLGMTPSNYRRGGKNMEIRFAISKCLLGLILVAQSALGVCAILLGDDSKALVHDLQERFPHANLMREDDNLKQLIVSVVGFIEAPEIGLDLPLDIRGTAFQQRVWQLLRQIPIGQTLSYTEVARRIGAPKSARAVAGACAANQIAIAIPCHRVVRSDGKISGYRWGIERKRTLLDNEGTVKKINVKNYDELNYGL
ncbi:AraC family transcriptional regulator [Candidatus Nitrosoglobus terrae]|uniref:methylated-DNA--[protein]-cysteine S-methyltransferase n=1 Tax=Candidatus Nitrosoglobus terrae TaxID=1630141 RepID=A0A1Q2SMN8_9GAMM|nr:bifunctional DNA-binding transcriptional regulator/O6-methylguanine-DNA methyltransferase Ada [Candidatus Nitrosoglobus terrae]BAW80382.1 AraC family transcriptional regulator [Candidatus Nitrosoglobus terrae]